ncbi:MAG TPA: Ig-like domain-containing protein [Humisphaera sp.]
MDAGELALDPELAGEMPAAPASDRPARPARPRRRLLLASAAALAACALVAVPVGAKLRGSGMKSALLGLVGMAPATVHHPTVAAVRPVSDGNLVPCDAFFAADVTLPNGGHVVDPATVNGGSVRLTRKGDPTPIPARVNTSAAGDALVLTPDRPLEPNTTYRFSVLPALKDTSGAAFEPFACLFTTGADGPASPLAAAFEQVALPATAGQVYTSLAVGPDGALYAGTYEGTVVRFALAADGTVASSQRVDAVRAACGAPRIVTGLCFDPRSTAGHPVLYVSHGQCARGPADDWTGKLSVLSGPTLSEYRDLVTGLPRASRDHLNNQMAFGPDGALYLSQGSNTAMGAADAHWGNRPERKLSAAILRIDLAALPADAPLDVRTAEGGTYDPAAAGAAVTLYATGVRSAYDLVWHRNGHLYVPINGSAAGGSTPGDAAAGVPALPDLRVTVPDHLADVRPGSFHGHPNPARGQYVMMGGNPTAGPDADEIPAYPVGTKPDPAWRAPAATFGRNLAPCGIIEYRAPGSPLDGALLVCRYSGGKDVVAMVPAADGSIAEMITGIDGLTRLADPLDLVQHPATGHLYVAEMGGKRITLVRAKPGATSARVFKQATTGPRPPIEMSPAAPHPVPAGEDHD